VWIDGVSEVAIISAASGMLSLDLGYRIARSFGLRFGNDVVGIIR
jgi:hypothetical protein